VRAVVLLLCAFFPIITFGSSVLPVAWTSAQISTDLGRDIGRITVEVRLNESHSRIAFLQLQTATVDQRLPKAVLESPRFDEYGVTGFRLNQMIIARSSGFCFDDCAPKGVVRIPFGDSEECEDGQLELVFTAKSIQSVSLTSCSGEMSDLYGPDAA